MPPCDTLEVPGSHRSLSFMSFQPMNFLVLLCLRTAVSQCDWSDTMGASEKTLGTLKYWTYYTTSDVDTVNIMVSRDDDYSSLTVYTKDTDSSYYGNYYTAASAENIESCYKTGSSIWVRSEPGPLYVWVKCNNVFRSCNFHYHIVFTCNGCSTTTEATTTEEAPATSTAQGDAVTYASTASTTVAETDWREDCNVDTCKCWSCGTSLSCKESKCTASETFVQTGCSGSIQIYNNVMQGGYTKSGYCAARVVANAASETAVSAVFLVMLALCML